MFYYTHTNTHTDTDTDAHKHTHTHIHIYPVPLRNISSVCKKKELEYRVLKRLEKYKIWTKEFRNITLLLAYEKIRRVKNNNRNDEIHFQMNIAHLTHLR